MEPRQTRSSRLRDLSKPSLPESSSLATNDSVLDHVPPSRTPSPAAKRVRTMDAQPEAPNTGDASSSACYVPASPLTPTSETSSATSASTPSTALTQSSSPSLSTPLTPSSPSPVLFQPNAPTHCSPNDNGSIAISASITGDLVGADSVASTEETINPHHLSSTATSTASTIAQAGVPCDGPTTPSAHTTAVTIKTECTLPPRAPPTLQPSTSASTSVASHDEPTDTTRICQETGAVVCTAPDRLRAERVVVDSWVSADTVERLRLFGNYSDHASPAFSLARIPSTAAWGDALPLCDVSGLLCIDNRPITAYIAGTVLKKWFTDYQGTLQSPVKVCIRPCRAIDLASANHWLSQSKPASGMSFNILAVCTISNAHLAVNLDCFWATRLMGEWPEDLDADKPEIVAFKNTYDATNPLYPHDDQHRKSTRFFDAGDIVLVEVLITRYKPKGTKSTGWTKYNVGYELKTIDVIARNPVRPNPNARPSLPTRAFNI